MTKAIIPFLLAVALSGATALSPAERAIESARSSINKAPGKPDGYSALAMALARRARETADPAFYVQAEEAVATALQKEPDNFVALRTKTWILLGRHEFAQALELAKKLNKRTPDDVLVYGMLADAHIELGNYKEAETAAQWMLDMGRGGVAGLTRAAYLRELFGDLEGAMELMRMSFERISPSETEDRAWVLTHLGHLLEQAGKPADASVVLEEALKLFPDYHYALASLAKVRQAEGRHADAVALLRKRCDLAPHPENFFDLAVALHKAGRPAEAQAMFRDFEKKALAESASWDNANRELAAYYSDYAKRPVDALKITSMEIARRRDVLTLDAHAWALYKAGRRVEAKKFIDEAVAVGTRDPKIVSHARTIAAVSARAR